MARSPSPPRLSLAIDQPRLAWLKAPFETAQLAGIRWIDLELVGSMLRARDSSVVRTANDAGVAIRAVWVPALTDGRRRFVRPEVLAQSTIGVVRASGASAVVLDRPSGTGTQRARQARLLSTVREHLPELTRLTFPVRPQNLVGTREHLTELATLRLLAEEWDFDIALDLKGPIDHLWESEAAVSKLLPRLTVVRLGAIESRPPGRGRERQTARVLAYLADVGYRGAIAISAGAPFWHPDRAVTLARSCQVTRQKIFARYTTSSEEYRIDSQFRQGERR